MECLSILSLAGVVLFYQDSAVIMAINLSKYTGGVAHIQNDAIITWLFQTVGTCAIPMTHGYRARQWEMYDFRYAGATTAY